MKDFHLDPFIMYEGANATLTLPASVTSIVLEKGIYSSVFKLYIKATTPPDLNDNSSYGPSYSIYVPTESVEAYKAADGWSKYASRIVAYDFE